MSLRLDYSQMFEGAQGINLHPTELVSHAILALQPLDCCLKQVH